jgi:hypothetical protein
MTSTHSRALSSLIVVSITAAAAEFYLVRELLAALLLFTVFFASAGTIILIVTLFQKVAFLGMGHLGSRLAYARAHHGTKSRRDHDLLIRRSRWN